MNVTVRIEGVRAIEDALGKAGPTLAAGAVRRGLHKGGEVFLERTKSLAPVLTEATPQRKPGELRDAIVQVDQMDVKRQAGHTRVGLEYTKRGTDDPAVYGLFVEFGTKNMHAHPFMRPAYDEGWQQALAAFVAELRSGVPELGKPE